MHLIVVGCEAFDGSHRVALGLDGEYEACAHGLAIYEDRARAADPVLAAEVGSGQPALVSQGVGQRRARLDDHGEALSVDI